jgi:hypothetical protein
MYISFPHRPSKLGTDPSNTLYATLATPRSRAPKDYLTWKRSGVAIRVVACNPWRRMTTAIAFGKHTSYRNARRAASIKFPSGLLFQLAKRRPPLPALRMKCPSPAAALKRAVAASPHASGLATDLPTLTHQAARQFESY